MVQAPVRISIHGGGVKESHTSASCILVMALAVGWQLGSRTNWQLTEIMLTDKRYLGSVTGRDINKSKL